jgi:hypothetical protein
MQSSVGDFFFFWYQTPAAVTGPISLSYTTRSRHRILAASGEFPQGSQGPSGEGPLGEPHCRVSCGGKRTAEPQAPPFLPQAGGLSARRDRAATSCDSAASNAASTAPAAMMMMDDEAAAALAALLSGKPFELPKPPPFDPSEFTVGDFRSWDRGGAGAAEEEDQSQVRLASLPRGRELPLGASA